MVLAPAHINDGLMVMRHSNSVYNDYSRTIGAAHDGQAHEPEKMEGACFAPRVNPRVSAYLSFNLDISYSCRCAHHVAHRVPLIAQTTR